nr:MAG TPA: hypothetical protein [Caudoviricetes sp.]
MNFSSFGNRNFEGLKKVFETSLQVSIRIFLLYVLL